MDRALFSEKSAAIERHLRRVEERLPPDLADFGPATDASDAVILHLWQAVQGIIDIAVSLCVEWGYGSPTSYADAFRSLAEAKAIDPALAERLQRAAGFRNLVAHAYTRLDMASVHQAARHGPQDLRAFLVQMKNQL